MTDQYIEKQVTKQDGVCENDIEFKQAFWKWFDSLPYKDKQRFLYYKIDMATTYFYNAVWSVSRNG